MTPRQPGGSGRTHSPQAKLVQDLVHLPPPTSSHPIYTAANILHIPHSALVLLHRPALFLFLSFTDGELRRRGRGEICESVASCGGGVV